MKKWFADLKLRYKLLIGMLFITFAALILISQLSYFYFYRRNTNEVLRKAENSVRMAGDTLSSQFVSLSAATDHMLAQEPFPRMISDINYGKFDGYSKYFSQTTALSNSFLQNHFLVKNLFICGEDGFLFSPSSLGMGDNFQALFAESLWGYSDITLFPTRFNSMSYQGDTVPVSYPVSCDPVGNGLTWKDRPETRKARFIMLLDTAQLRSYFDRMANSYTYCMYLADENGMPLDITEEEYPDAFLPGVKAWVSGSSGFHEGTLENSDDMIFMDTDSIKFRNLKVVHLTKKSALTGDIRELRSFFVLVGLACFLAAALLSLALSQLLTKNLKILGRIIGKINNNTYREKISFPYSDEISLLGIQLNQMYDTIELQLVQIKKEEQKKAEAEIQMMSEQINPHFLYNTLECIHFQVLNGNTDTAAGMLESLGRYLRITLSVGRTFITVEKEVEHAATYMEIMNRGSSGGIKFSADIKPELMNRQIMKNLLQPLAENSIKHGFGGIGNGLLPVSPRIEVKISSEKGRIHIELSDNGKGIDLKKAYSCLEPENDVNISFSSIPYLKNSVIIEIPDREFQKKFV